MENKQTHTHKILITAEMTQAPLINQHIELRGCQDFIIKALSEIFVTIHEKDPELFIMALGSAIEKIEDSK